MAAEHAKIWLISRRAKSYPWNYVFHSLGEAVGIYFAMYLFFLFFREIGIELYVFLGVFILATLWRFQVIETKAKRKMDRAVGHRFPVKGDVKARIYMVMFFSALVVVTNRNPLVSEHFLVPENQERIQWTYFIVDNLLRALLLDFFEIFEFGVSDIQATTKVGSVLVFVLRSLIALAAFEFVRARIREINVTEVFNGTKDQAIFYLNQSYINPETFQLTEINVGDVHEVAKISYAPPKVEAPIEKPNQTP